MIYGFGDQNTFRCGVFHGKVVLLLARSYFSGIFRIFRDLFELDLLLRLTRKYQEELGAIIAINQDMYVKIVG